MEVRAASPDRVLSPAETCPGCDWGHFELTAAREAKRALFLETMQRIARLAPEAFGDLPIAPSPLGYRVRNRFHFEGRGADLVVGQFASRTHRVESVGNCRALTARTAMLLSPVREQLAASGAAVSELATLEDFAGDRRLARVVLSAAPKRQMRSGAEAIAHALTQFFAGVKVVDPEGRTLVSAGEPRVSIMAGGRVFQVSVDSFFQGNRHLAGRMLADVAQGTAGPAGDALDAFGGVGFFAAALLDAGHSVTSVEGSPGAARDAVKTRLGWSDADRWKIHPSSVAGFLASSPGRFDRVVADPPRAGLARLSRPLAGRARRQLVYVSCEPTTLARDLRELLEEGFEIADARLYDLFPLTHRVEAVVTLVRGADKSA